MDVATPRPLSAADLNFNPARFPRGQLADFARAHWGVDGELTPLDGERDQNHRVKTADGASYVLKVAGAFNMSVPMTARSITGNVRSGTYILSVLAVNSCGSGVETATQTVTVP